MGKLRFGAGTMTIGSAVLTQFSNVTERRTNEEIDGQTGVPTMAKAAVESNVPFQIQRIFNMYSNGHGIHSNAHHGNSKNI